MEEQQRSGFWSTLPGILTGSAALITAATGGYLAFDRTQGVAKHNTDPPPEVRPIPQADAAPAQAANSDPPAAVVDSPRHLIGSQARPSFNCALAATAVENMLCSDVGLAERDRQVAAQYFALRRTLPPNVRSQLHQSQKYFLERRDGCSTSHCLSAVYDDRLRQLDELASN